MDIGDRRFVATNLSNCGFGLIGQIESWEIGQTLNSTMIFETSDGVRKIRLDIIVMRTEPGMTGFKFADLGQICQDDINYLTEHHGF
jgi:hypothetical protein